jgi:hypothetical protein
VSQTYGNTGSFQVKSNSNSVTYCPESSDEDVE